ncbi:hypothetical protein L1987_29526 [Smallanthus sonchifolius]|uniref:Uncharacterized protein n=1 Tax=Smallanthus sonchifolius TaxID=185202 RepID=A0ACB9I1I9_9ASTR|nr:hypothetical protein L1987_29526 [Smallanthus sonchifolius]
MVHTRVLGGIADVQVLVPNLQMVWLYTWVASCFIYPHAFFSSQKHRSKLGFSPFIIVVPLASLFFPPFSSTARHQGCLRNCCL